MTEQQQLTIFRQWLQCHRGVLMKVARSFCLVPADRDDLLQEISFQLWNSVPGFHQQVAVTTWIYRVSLYTAIGWSKKQRRHHEKRFSLDDPELLQQPSESTDPRLDWLYQQIGELDELDRSLTLLLLDGFSYQDMADTLGISVSNVGVKINRIKKWLIDRSQRDQIRKDQANGF